MVRTSLPLASRLRRPTVACLAFALALAASSASTPETRAGDAPPELLIRDKTTVDRHALPQADGADKRAGQSRKGWGDWLLSTSGLVLALAVFGGLSLASKRWLCQRAPGPVEVMARASLSPKHAVYLVRVADRTLILGTGAQGPPALLGELASASVPEREGIVVPLPGQQPAIPAGGES